MKRGLSLVTYIFYIFFFAVPRLYCVLAGRYGSDGAPAGSSWEKRVLRVSSLRFKVSSGVYEI
jgi:hypothetical protein